MYQRSSGMTVNRSRNQERDAVMRAIWKGSLGFGQTQLIDALTGDFDPTAHTDNYREALSALIDAKATHQPLPAIPDRSPDGGDLIAVLRASITAAHTPPDAAKLPDDTRQAPAEEPPRKTA